MKTEFENLIKAAKDFSEYQSIGNGAKLNVAIESAENLLHELGPKSTITTEEYLKLSELKELYVKHTNQGTTDNEYKTLELVSEQLSYCFCVNTKL